MANDHCEIQRKFRILQHAQKIGDTCKTCCYLGVGRASFLLYGAQPISAVVKLIWSTEGRFRRTQPIRQLPRSRRRVLHLRRKYQLGPLRIVWYLKRYHGNARSNLRGQDSEQLPAPRSLQVPKRCLIHQ